jgi:putative membrane protein
VTANERRDSLSSHVVSNNDDEHGKRPDDMAEVEPDYRFTLANERTYLAWERTALGLLAAAVAVVQLVPELSIPGARHVLGIILALLAILTAGMGILRWRQVDRAMRRDLPLPRHPTPVYLGIGLVLVGLLTVGFVVVKAVTG